MIIKKFTGKTEAEATEAAKKELGNGLVIMNVREVKKKGLFSFLSPKQIEVTAALEDESPQRSVVNSLNRTEASGAGVGTAKTVSMKNSTENIEKKLDSLQTLLESQLNSRPVDANTEKAAEAQKEALDSEAEAAVEKQEEISSSVCCITKCWIMRWMKNMSTVFWRMLPRQRKRIFPLIIYWRIFIRRWC